MLAFPKRRLPELSGFLTARGIQVQGDLAGVGDQAVCEGGGARVRIQVSPAVPFPSDPLPVPVAWIAVKISTESFRPCNLRANDQCFASAVAGYVELFVGSVLSRTTRHS